MNEWNSLQLEVSNAKQIAVFKTMIITKKKIPFSLFIIQLV